MHFYRELLLKGLLEDLNNRKIIILFGARQVGKTFLLERLHEKIKKSTIFRLEEPEDLMLFNKNDSEILRKLRESGDVVFLDEFHYIKNISHIFKAVFDSRKKPKIYATGSSALEMHKHLQESMAGRFKAYYIKPLGLEEFRTNKHLSLEDFLTYGALPGVYYTKDNPSMKDRQNYLRQILQTYIQKDVKSLVKEDNISAFNNLLFILAENQGQIVSHSNLSREIGLSVHTVERYLSILEQTFVIYRLKSFSQNLSNELKKSQKYYFYDLGIRNALLKNFQHTQKRLDKGCIWESFVYHYLLNIHDESDTDIYFWRTSNNAEVDFIYLRNRIPYPIEVKSKLGSMSVPEGMKSFLNHYTQTPFGLVINEKYHGEIMYRGKQIHFIKFEEIEILRDLLSKDFLL